MVIYYLFSSIRITKIYLFFIKFIEHFVISHVPSTLLFSRVATRAELVGGQLVYII